MIKNILKLRNIIRLIQMSKNSLNFKRRLNQTMKFGWSENFNDHPLVNSIIFVRTLLPIQKVEICYIFVGALFKKF
jgi:hypothetical protein